MLRGLVVGGNGLLGNRIAALASARGWEISNAARNDDGSAGPVVDLTRPPSDHERFDGYDVVFLFGGITTFSRCRADPLLALQTNAFGTVRWIHRFRADGCFVVFPSSSSVFSGDEQTPSELEALSPTSVYGIAKASVEVALNDNVPDVAIARLTKVVDPRQPLFADWISALRRGRTVTAYDNTRLSPLPTSVAAGACLTLAERRIAGVVNFSGDGDVTYFEFARLLAGRLGVSADHVLAQTADPSLVNVQEFAALDVHRARELLGFIPPTVASTVDFLADPALETIGDAREGTPD